MRLKKILNLIIKAKLDAPVYKAKKFLDNKEKKFVYVFLSTRTRDEITLAATQRIYKNHSSIWELKDEEYLAELIKPVAFYKKKANNLLTITKNYNYIPENLNELLKLPGVGIKVAKVFLANLGKNYIGVDTHVHRIANRIGIVKTQKIEKTDEELEKIVPNSLKSLVNTHFVALGQVICKAKAPKCDICPINEYCNYNLKI